MLAAWRTPWTRDLTLPHYHNLHRHRLLLTNDLANGEAIVTRRLVTPPGQGDEHRFSKVGVVRPHHTSCVELRGSRCVDDEFNLGAIASGAPEWGVRGPKLGPLTLIQAPGPLLHCALAIDGTASEVRAVGGLGRAGTGTGLPRGVGAGGAGSNRGQGPGRIPRPRGAPKGRLAAER